MTIDGRLDHHDRQAIRQRARLDRSGALAADGAGADRFGMALEHMRLVEEAHRAADGRVRVLAGPSRAAPALSRRDSRSGT
jgi:hypothetical protein